MGSNRVVEAQLKALDWHLVPQSLRPAMRAWIGYGRRPGDFLSAVIRNDLTSAVFRADPINLHKLKEIMLFMENEAPTHCWGSPLEMHFWQERGGLEGTDK